MSTHWFLWMFEFEENDKVICSVNRPTSRNKWFNKLLINLLASNTLNYYFNIVFICHSFLVLTVQEFKLQNHFASFSKFNKNTIHGRVCSSLISTINTSVNNLNWEHKQEWTKTGQSIDHLNLKGVFAKNELGYRLNAIKSAFDRY